MPIKAEIISNLSGFLEILTR